LRLRTDVHKKSAASKTGALFFISGLNTSSLNTD
jgi:hypothetical protein